MKMFAKIALSAAVLGSFAFAANFNTVKNQEISNLTKKEQLIQKRLQCIKGAKSAKDLKACKKKFSLLNRKKAAAKKMMKNKKAAMMKKANAKKSKFKSMKQNAQKKFMSK